eukprot:2764894-Rhodomonas_salina.1
MRSCSRNEVAVAVDRAGSRDTAALRIPAAVICVYLTRITILDLAMRIMVACTICSTRTS